jgi:aryl-alcohol dehydrogenase-like predicted oxidoreductase
METRALGTMQLSLAGLGLAFFGSEGDYAAAEKLIHTALDSGVNFFDAADIYGVTAKGEYRAEPFLGRALRKRRHKVFISTKYGYATDTRELKFRGLDAKYTIAACEASLRRLRTDYIDLYQPHAPDPNVPIEETLTALDKLVRQGKVRFIGSSRFTPQQIAAADATSRERKVTRFVSAQNGLNLLQRAAKREVIPLCEKLDLGFIPFGPLAQGFLTGKYKRAEPPPADSRIARSRSTLG